MSKENYPQILEKAISFGQKRQYDKSIDALMGLISETDEVPDAYLFLGRAFHAQKKFEHAIYYLKIYIEMIPNSHKGHFFLGRSLLAMDHNKLALFHLKAAVELGGENPIPLALLGLACLKCRKPRNAVDLLERAVNLSAGNKKIFMLYLNALFIKAIRDFHAGEIDLAQQAFLFVQEYGVNNILLHLYLAYCFRDLGDLPQALSHFESALEYAPDDELIQLQRTMVVFAMGNLDQAVSQAEDLGQRITNIADLFENPDVYHRYMAFELHYKSQYRKSVYYARKLLLDNPEDLELRILMSENFKNLGEYQKAENHARRAIRIKRTSIEAHYCLGTTFWLKGDYQGVLDIMKQILKLDPKNDLALYYCALALVKLNSALSVCLKAVESQLKKNPADPYLLCARALIYERESDDASAFMLYEKAIKVRPQMKDALEGLILISIRSEDKKSALKYFRIYSETSSDSMPLRRKLIIFLVDQSDWPTAVLEIKSYLSLRNDNSMASLMGYCLRKNKKYKEAAGIYRDLLRQNPRDEIVLKNLIWCLDKGRNRSKAIALLVAASSFMKLHPEIRLILGILYLKDQNNEKALSIFRELTSDMPKDPRPLYNIGLIYQKMNMSELSAKFFKKAQELSEKKAKTKK